MQKVDLSEAFIEQVKCIEKQTPLVSPGGGCSESIPAEYERI